MRDNAHSYTFPPDSEDDSANVNAKVRIKCLVYVTISVINQFIFTQQMKELLSLLAMKNGHTKTKSKTKNKLVLDDKTDTSVLIAKLAIEASKDHIHKRRDPSIGANENDNVKFENSTPNATSAEELEIILQKLKLMGAKGKRVLELLKKQVTLNGEDDVVPTSENSKSSSTTPPTITPFSTTTSTSSTSSVSSKSPSKIEETESIEENLLRQKREFILKTALKSKELNDENEESENLAIEEVRYS